MTTHETKNSLPEQTRQAMIGLLQKNLADAIDLSYQAKQAHWNVKGPNFIAVHELFDQVHETTEGHADTIAERLMVLGGQAEGTVAAAAEQTRLPTYPLDISKAEDHLEQISNAYAEFSKNARAGIDEAAEAGDQATADLFTEVVRETDKALYFLESHIEK